MEMPGLPTLPSSELTHITRPDCCGIMCWKARRIVQKVCQKFHTSESCMASSVRSTIGACPDAPPALATRMSMRPKWATVPSMMASHDSRCFTSPAM